VLARTIHRQDKTTGLTWMELVGPRLSRYEAGTGASRLYEYGWTLGFRLGAAPREREGARGLLHRTREQDVPPGQATAISVSLLFPVWADRYVSAHTATLKHLSPVEKEEQWRQRLAADWNDLAPAVGVVGTVATDVTGLAPIGSVAKAVASLRATSVPQTPDALWLVRAIDDLDDPGHIRHGVQWEIPRPLLVEVGTQISGSVLVSMTVADTAFRGGKAQDPTAPVLSAASLMAGETELERLPATGEPHLALDVFGRSGL
jgi:hypothetical protein